MGNDVSRRSGRRRVQANACATLASLLIGALLPACGEDGARPERKGGPGQGAPPATASVEKPLNVLLITLDTVRADALGAYGQALDTSPAIDRLAREGALFTQAMSSAPLTLPSHSSILTGKYTYAHGARSNSGSRLSLENVTLAEAFQSRGYLTAAEVATYTLNHTTQIDQGFQHFRDMTSPDVSPLVGKIHREGGAVGEIALPERRASDISNRGIEFLARHREEPFFLWLHYFDPHASYIPPPEFLKMFPDHPYYGEIRYADREIGRVLDQLDRLGLRDRTLVVLTSDHGEGLGEHNEDHHSYFVYESTMHVPLVIRGPGEIREDWQVKTLVRTVDIAPTILELAGLPALDDIQGVSLVDLLSGRADDLNLTGYGDSIEFMATFGTSVLRCFRVGKWKYIHKVEPELYDLSVDPGELRNLAAAEPEKLEELREGLRELLEDAPPPPADTEAVVDAETFQRLQALGYAGVMKAANFENELAVFDVEPPDPNTMADDVRLYFEGRRLNISQQYREASRLFEKLNRRYPNNFSILANLGEALHGEGRFEEAIPVLERTLAEIPAYLPARRWLVESAEKTGDLGKTRSALEALLAREPCDVPSRLKLAQIHHSARAYAKERDILAQGSKSCPERFEFLNAYAFLLASAPDAALRDGAEAIRLATSATQMPGGERPEVLDTLASAYAEAGEFDRAISVEERALKLARQRKVPPALVAQLQASLQSFRARTPIRYP